MTEFRFLNGKDARQYVAPPTGRAAANLPEQELHEGEDTRQVILRHIARLTREHRLLDEHVDALLHGGLPMDDELGLRRLKKRKLLLKDRIVALRMQLVPDIPA